MRTLVCTLGLLAVSGPARAEDPPEPQQVGLMPLTLEGMASKSTRQALEDHLREGLLRGRVEINLFNEDGACKTAPCRDALEGEDVIVVRPHVQVHGRDYVIEVDLFRMGTRETLASFDNACDDCEAGDVGDLIAELAAEFIASVEVQPIEPEPVREEQTKAAEPAPPPAKPEDSKEQRAIRPVWGWLALAGGVGLAGAGVPMVVLDGRPHKSTCPPQSQDVNGTCPNVWTTKALGIGLLAGGGALVATGVGLLVASYRGKKNRDDEAHARLAPGLGSLSVVGRF